MHIFVSKARLAAAGMTAVLFASIAYPNAVAFADTLSSSANGTVPLSIPNPSTPPAGASSVNGIATTDRSVSVTAADVATTLAHDTGVFAASDKTNAASDADTAIQAVTAGATVEVPKDPNEGVTLGATNGPKLEIQLSNANSSQDAAQIAPGTVAYSSTNGSANAVQATEDGGVRMLTVIDNPNAPTAYSYNVTIPDGGIIQLTIDGGAVVIGLDGTVFATVAAPWAHDALGRTVRTYFTTNGANLTQHIEHNVPGVVYPVTADPWWTSRFWSYVSCIVGIGAPIGTAYVIATFPGTWRAIYLWASRQAAGGDRTIITYVDRVGRSCQRYINSY